MTLILSANNVTHQEEAAQASATALVDLKIWLAENITNADVAHFRVKDNNLYKLNTPIPFTTIDFATEFTEGKWSLLIKGSNVDFTQTILNLINAKENITDVDDKLDLLENKILGGAGDAFDTLLELFDLISENDQDITGILTALANRLRFDINSQNLSTTQKTNALTNLGISAKEIIASGAVFAWHKKPSNATATLAATEIITNGRISDTIHIKSAEYVSGDINAFGTLAGFFKDGSYKKVEYRNF
ncbi:hypothetical protein BST83_13325 [Polaribacter filamentus]|uniref:Uncharacterized protein n=1 Tax=Polaribacter filamentus TaxID=53483 RepID=A0A2S7KZU5_9FLAO|nr:hypothetical protein [Polaribacter filamentus]PQB08023.1 hypothetical protein BST83_13325 [Polaribacter filamentus]